MPSQPADFQTQLAARLNDSVRRLDLPWSAERAERIRAGVWQRHRSRLRQRAVLRVAGGLGLFLAALLLPRLWTTLPERYAGWLGRQPTAPLVAGRTAPRSDVSVERSPTRPILTALDPASPPAVPPTKPSPEPLGPSALRLADGSLASPRKNSAVAVRQEGASRVVVELLHGSAEFAVTKNPGRLFRVETSGVAVEVLGTRFVVDKQPINDGWRVAVTVTEGRVRVLFSAQQAQLAAGERAEFQVPRDAIAPASPEPPTPTQLGSARPTVTRAKSPSVATATPPPTSPVPTAATEPPRWQQLARQGQYDQAYALLTQQSAQPGSAPVAGEGAVILSPLASTRHSAADLLLLADVARLSHHPDTAVASLRQLLDGHSDDPRAPLAAFTLGRILLDDLGRSREAAESFQRTQALDGDGPMAQDALAREVEAWSRAGDRTRCRERAQKYIQRYPSGRRLQAVRHYADLPAE